MKFLPLTEQQSAAEFRKTEKRRKPFCFFLLHNFQSMDSDDQMWRRSGHIVYNAYIAVAIQCDRLYNTLIRRRTQFHHHQYYSFMGY